MSVLMAFPEILFTLRLLGIIGPWARAAFFPNLFA
jgi:hypothetical protein